MYVRKKKTERVKLIILLKADVKIARLCISVKVFTLTPRDIRLNCSHYCVYEFPSSRERNMISAELGVSKEKFKVATEKPFSFL